MAYIKSNEFVNKNYSNDKHKNTRTNESPSKNKKQIEEITDADTAVEIAVDLDDDSNLSTSFNKNRHTDVIEGINCISQSWRMRERMKTVSVALVLCLNVGVDPPDVVKIQPCARVESWIDPSSVSPQKALELIGSNLQKQYERWQPRARYKQSLDPTVDDIKKLCTSLRRNAKEERVLFHYNGHGVPRPTTNGEIWVFNRNYTQYIPLSVYDLQAWMGAPSIYVYDCSNAGIIVNSFNTFADQHEKELDQLQINARNVNGCTNATTTTNPNSSLFSIATNQPTDTTSTSATNNSVPFPKATINNSSSHSTSGITYKNCIQLAACSSNQNLPMNPQLPADLFTSCLTTPIKIALKWYILQQTSKLIPHVSYDLIERIPGQLNDRRTMLGELNWVFTAITDTIAWNTLPRDLFQKLFRQDLLVASLFRNYLLAERILRSYDCTPISSPSMPPCYRHSMWLAWDLSLDLALSQLPEIVEKGMPFKQSPFFEEQLTAFQVWLEGSREKRSPPEQLPIVLQVLLSQVHRLRALELLGRFLNLGPWAVNLALSVGIFPYVLKLLQSSAKELRPCLIFIWAKILAVDSTCQIDLVRDNGLKYFLAAIQDQSYLNTCNSTYRTFAAFVLSSIVHNFPTAQKQASQASLVSICLVQMNDENPILRQWLAICLGNLWKNCNIIRWAGVRDLAHEKLYTLLQDPVPEVRAAACYALGTFISSVTNRSEHANNIDRSIAMTLLLTVGNDISSIVRMELLAALQWMIIIFENKFVDIYVEEQISAYNKSKLQQQNPQRSGGTTPLLSSNNSNRKNPMIRVSSIGSLINLGGGNLSSSTHHLHQQTTPTTSPLSTPSLSAVSFSSIYLKIWNCIDILSQDAYEPVAHMAQKIINYVFKQSSEHRIAKKSLNYDKILTTSAGANNVNDGSAVSGGNSNYYSLPPSPKTTVNASSTAALAQLTSTLEKQPQPPSTQPDARKVIKPQASGSATSSGSVNDEAQVQSTEDQPMKPIIHTHYLDWSIGFFARQSQEFFSNPKSSSQAPEQKSEDENSSEYINRSLRFKLNKKIRDEAKYDQQQHQLSLNLSNNYTNPLSSTISNIRLEQQVWIGRTQCVPQLVKLHPYSSKILIAYNDKVLLHDYESNIISNTYLPQRSTNALGSSLLTVNRVSSIDFINPHDMRTLVLVCYGNGVIRIWRDKRTQSNQSTNDSRISSGGDDSSTSNDFLSAPLSHEHNSDNDMNSLYNTQLSSSPVHNSASTVMPSSLLMSTSANNSLNTNTTIDASYPFCNFSVSDESLVTAFNGLSDVNSTKKTNHITNALAAWNQLTHTIAISGNSKIIRLWDTETELKIGDLKTGTDAAICTLKFSPNGLLVAGSDDGSIRLFDKRLPTNQTCIMTYREHNNNLLTATLRDDAHNSLVSACAIGNVRLYDIRAQQSISSFNVGVDVTAVSVHRTANIVACATQFITIYKMDGRQQSTIRYNEGFMTPRLSPTSCLSFHPYKINLAACFTDNNVSIFKSPNS